MGKESAYTSINQIPAVFKKFEVGKVNFDFGGGKYNTATHYLKKHDTINLVFDPYNRSKEHNENTLRDACLHGVLSITCLNILNVIQSKKERKEVLEHIRAIYDRHKVDNPVIIFQMYEGNRTGVPGVKTAQTNMKTADYIPEIRKVFPEWEVQRFGNVLVV